MTARTCLVMDLGNSSTRRVRRNILKIFIEMAMNCQVRIGHGLNAPCLSLSGVATSLGRAGLQRQTPYRSFFFMVFLSPKQHSRKGRFFPFRSCLHFTNFIYFRTNNSKFNFLERQLFGTIFML